MRKHNLKQVALLGLASGMIISNEAQSEELSPQIDKDYQQKYLIAACGTSCGSTSSHNLEEVLDLNSDDLQTINSDEKPSNLNENQKNNNFQQNSIEPSIEQKNSPLTTDRVVRYNPRVKAEYYYEYTAEAEEFFNKEMDETFTQNQLLSVLDEKEKGIYLFKLSPSQQLLVIERMNLKIKPEHKYLPLNEYKQQMTKAFYLSLPSDVINQLSND